MAQGGATTDQTIRIEGGLPELPGTNVTMPQLNGHMVDERALAAPELRRSRPE